MKRAAMVFITLMAGSAVAQDLEPAVRTSSAAAPGEAATKPPAPTVPPAAATASGPATSPASPATPTGRAAARSAKPTARRGAGGPPALDKVELDTMEVRGNRELPNVMFIVPWKKPNLGDFAGRPPKSLLDELLAPVDREVFQRQNRYFAALQPDAAAKAPGAAPAPSPATQSGTGTGPAAGPASGDEK